MLKTIAAAIVVLIAAAGPAVAADRSAGQVVDDAKIALEVKTKLAADKLANLTKTNVTVRNGVVTLDGTVDTEERKTHATAIAQRIDGVKEVVNNLEVASPRSASPPTVTTK
jgi:osmotically-inducible protein OsmY